jgi:hypothetical protein
VSVGPVFVTGLADSGKTPLGRMLTDRTSIVITRHTQLWRRFAGRFGDLRQTENLQRCLATLLGDPAVTRLGLDTERVRASLADVEPTYTAIFSRLHAQYAEQRGKRRWGEQCGGLETYAPQLLRDLPAARVIHLVRDPVMSYRIASGRVGKGPGRLGRFTARWVASAELARAHVERFPEQYLVVRYESLTSRPEETTRAVCAFLDEPVADGDLTMSGDLRTEPWQGFPGAVGKYGPGAQAIGAEADGEEERFIATHAVRQLRLLGYDPVPSWSGRPGSTYLAQWPANRLALAVTRGQTPAAWPSWSGG